MKVSIRKMIGSCNMYSIITRVSKTVVELTFGMDLPQDPSQDLPQEHSQEQALGQFKTKTLWKIWLRPCSSYEKDLGFP